MSESATTPRSDPLPITTGTQDRLEKALSRLPFRTHLSLEPLFEELARLGKEVPHLASLEALRGTSHDLITAVSLVAPDGELATGRLQVRSVPRSTTPMPPRPTSTSIR